MESSAANFRCYALVIDEATDTAQLAFSFRELDNEYVIEEMASLVPLKDAMKFVWNSKNYTKAQVSFLGYHVYS